MANSVELQLKIDEALLDRVLAAIPGKLRKSGEAAEKAGSEAFNKAGVTSGQKFEEGVKTATTGAGGQAAGEKVGASLQRGFVGKLSGLGGEIGGILKKNTASIGQGIGQSIGLSMTNALMGAIGGLAGALGNLKNLSEFDAAARKASTLTDDMAALEKGAFKLARELGNTATATDLLNAAEPVLSSGFSKTADVLTILRAAQIGAVGGFSDVNTVADAATTVITAYGLAAKDAGEIVQWFAGMQNAGKLRINDVATNIGKLASLAAQAGVTREEIGGVISVATAKGVRVSSAFDGYRQAISAMLDPSKKAEKAAKDLGIEFDALSLKKAGVLGVLKALDGKAGGAELSKLGANAKDAAANIEKMKNTPVIASLVQLFGSVEAVAAIAPLAGEGLKDYAKALKTAAGTDPNDAFKKVAGGIAEQQKAFGNKVIDLDVKIKTGFVGDALGSGLRIVNQALGGVADGLEKLNAAYAALDPVQKGFANTLGGIGFGAIAAATGLIGLGAAFAIIGPAIKGGAIAVGLFGKSVASIAIAAAPIAIPIAAASFAVYGLAKALGATNADAFKAAMITAAAGIAAVFGPAAIAAVANGVTALVIGFGNIAIAATAAIIPLIPWIAAAALVVGALYLLKIAYDKNKVAIDAWFQGVVKAVAPAWDAIKNFAAGSAKAISDFASAAGPVILKVGKDIFDFGVKVFNALKPVVEWVGQYFGASFNLAAAIIGRSIQGLISDFKFKAEIIIAAVKIMAAIFGWLADRAKEGLGIIQAQLSKLANGFGSARNSIGGSMQSISDIVATNISKARKQFPLLDQALKAGELTFKSFGNTAKTVFDGIVAVVQGVVDSIKNIPKALNDAAGMINGFSGKANKNLGSIQAPAPPPIKAPAAAPTSPATSSRSGDGVLVASAGDLSGLGIGRAMDGQIAQRQSDGEYVRVNASRYKPGGGGINGPEVDGQGRRLTDNQLVVATPGNNLLKTQIPTGTILEIVNPRTGLKVQAEARDSGPYAPGRELDITGAVAKAIGFNGREPLDVRIVQLPAGADPNATYNFGVAKQFGIDKRSNISPGTEIRYQGSGTQIAQQPRQRVVGPIQGADNFALAESSPPHERKGAARYRKGRLVEGAHQGQDFAAPAGTPVVSSYTGTAKVSNWATAENPTYGLAVTVSFIDDKGRKVEVTDGHLNPASVLRALGVGAGSTVQVQAGQEIGAVADLGADFRRRNPGVRNHAHREIRVDRRLVNPVEYMRAGRGESAHGTSTDRQLAAAKEDVSIAEQELQQAQVRRTTSTGRGKKKRQVPESEEKYNKRVQSARIKLRNAKNRLVNLEEKDGKSAEQAAEEARNTEINEVKNRLDDLDSYVAQQGAEVDRAVAEGRQTARSGEADKRSLLESQSQLADELKPQLEALSKKYPDRESESTILSLRERIDSLGRAAAVAKKDGQRFNIDDFDRGIVDDITRTSFENKAIDYRASQGEITADQAASMKADNLMEAAEELRVLLPTLRDMLARSEDPEQAAKLRTAIGSIQDLSIEATRAKNELTAGQFKTGVDLRLSNADKEAQDVRNQRLLGAISEKQEQEQLLSIRLKTADSLDLLIPKLEQVRAIQTDPAVIEQLNEQIAKIRQYSAEATGAARAEQQALKESSSIYQLNKELIDVGNAAGKELFLDLFKGAQNVGSIIDNLINKIADIGLNAIFDKVLGSGSPKGSFLGSLGALFGLKDGGPVRNYSTGGSVGGMISGAANGSIGAAFGLARAYSTAMRKEGAGAVPIVAKVDEEVLSIPNARLYRSLVADGTWANLQQVHNYSSAGTVTRSGGRQTAVGRASAGGERAQPISVRVDEINSVQYVSVDQLQSILELELPRTAKAGAAITEQNLTRTNWRQSYSL
jgi:TP901 family phage tail tape measure protein